MKVLVACEESQRVALAFLNRGHDAYSCDIVKCSGGRPDRHIMMDAKAVMNGGKMKLQGGGYIMIEQWDLIIAHPPCTYLSNVATRHHSLNTSPINWINARTENRIEAMRFFMRCIEANAERIAVENPVGIMNTAYRRPDQIIHPYMFAKTEDEEVTKATCLWLKGLPPLLPIRAEKPDNRARFGEHPTGKARCWEDEMHGANTRSKTFFGIAEAMATQWG